MVEGIPRGRSATARMALEANRATICARHGRRREERSAATEGEGTMRKAFELGGVIAAAVLIAFGIAAIVMGFNGKSTVNSSLKQEQITGTPDMTPAAIAGEVKAAQAAQDKLFADYKAHGMKVTATPIDDADLLRGEQGHRQRHGRPLLREVHADPHVRRQLGPDLLADGPLHRRARHAVQVHGRPGRDQRPDEGDERPEDAAAGRQRPPRHLGHLHRTDDRAELQLHGFAARAVRRRRRHRPAARRDRLRDPRPRRGASRARAPRSPGSARDRPSRHAPAKA